MISVVHAELLTRISPVEENRGSATQLALVAWFVPLPLFFLAAFDFRHLWACVKLFVEYFPFLKSVEVVAVGANWVKIFFLSDE